MRNVRWGFRFIHEREPQDNKIIGLLRLRNESLLLRDTLDHMSQHVDGVVIFDDSSTDDSVEIARKHPLVTDIIVNKHWKKNNRKWEETANRSIIYKYAKKKYNPEWFFYFDADERFEGDIRGILTDKKFSNIDGIRVSLLDAYITKNDQTAYKSGQKLYGSREMFGIERRDILMIWRNNGKAKYILPDSREPAGIAGEATLINFWCQHYGKAVSIDQWEETCKYYAENFPMYADKWRARVGKAIHSKSDFDTKLYNWEDAKKYSIPLV